MKMSKKQKRQSENTEQTTVETEIDDFMEEVDKAFEENYEKEDFHVNENDIDTRDTFEVKEKDIDKTEEYELSENDIDSDVETNISDEGYETVEQTKLKEDDFPPIRKFVKREKDEEETEETMESKAPKKLVNTLLIFFISVTLVASITAFIICILDKNSSVQAIIASAILALFTIIYLVACLTAKKKKNYLFIIGALLLLSYVACSMTNTTAFATTDAIDFNGKSLTEVVKWAKENKIKINQEYEYSDMVPEYGIISQDVKYASNTKDIEEITVSVSEGPNPYKEIIVPSMLTWDSERVINYVLSNYLSNVTIEFKDSDQVKDTVIEQSSSGNLKRNDELKLTFSYGEDQKEEETSLIDFTDKTKFEIEFYMKQHRLNYEFSEDFSEKIKKGNGLKQDKEAGTKVKTEEATIKVTISKGPKIEVPDVKNMTIQEITEWAIKNKLKLEFTDKYDEAVKYGNIISIDKEKGEIVEQGTTIKAILSLGNLKMRNFKTADEFYEWADKYEIKYETRREFSTTVKVGEIISFSHKKGDIIKNEEAVVITISDGAKVEVPKLIGLSKSEATTKLKNANLNYNFVYKNSTTTKDQVLGQSISAGSEVSSETTITVTLSNGKTTTSTQNNNNNASNNNNNNNNDNSSSQQRTETPKQETPTCSPCTIIGVRNEVYNNNEGYENTKNALVSYISGQCPGIKVEVSKDQTSGKKSGVYVSGFYQGDTYNGEKITTCSTIKISLAE